MNCSKADLAHILALQGGQLLRQVVGVHIPVAGDQQAAAVILHQRQIPAPFVLHPHGVEIFRLGAHYQHHLGAVQGGENIRLILLAQLVFQCDTAEKYLIALIGELIIYFLGQGGILGPAAEIIRFFIADKHIIRLFLGGNGQDALLDFRNAMGFLLIQSAGSRVRGVFQRG